MPDKKLTDSEIVKALECCKNGKCEDDCPFSVDREKCFKLDDLVLDLINRLKEENNKYNKIKELLDMFWNVLLKIGMAKQNEECFTLEEFAEALQDIQDKAKADAYKEFAERLKEQKYQSSDWSHGEHPYVVEESDIDEVLEELVGE